MDVRSHSHRGCCGIRIEKICYIFAVFNVVFVLLFALTCIATEALLVTRIVISFIHNDFYQFMPTWVVIFPVYAVMCVLTVVSGVFAVLLLQGIRLKKPELVMAYRYFGIILEILMISATVISIAFFLIVRRISEQNYGFVCGVISLEIVICAIYGYILCLVRITYLILLSRKNTDIVNEQTMLYICEEYLPALEI